MPNPMFPGMGNALSALNAPTGQHPLNPIMQPGGGTTGAPLQGGVQHFPTPVPPQPMPGGGNPGFGRPGMMGGLADWRTALMDWRALRPDHPQFGGLDPAARQAAQQDWRTQMQDYRQQRPMPFDYFGQPQQGIAVGEPALPINPAA